jgi:hypothetical protein
LLDQPETPFIRKTCPAQPHIPFGGRSRRKAMKKDLSVLAITVLVCALATLAQNAGSASSNSENSAQAGSSSGASGSMSSQAGSQTSSAGSDTEQMMEGCIIREQQDYYLEPVSGQEVHLSGPDVAQHANHHVRIHGNEQPNQSNTSSSAGTSGTMAGSSSSGSSSAANPPEFLVTRVDMVSESCPANLKHRPASSQTPSSGTTHNDQTGPK